MNSSANSCIIAVHGGAGYHSVDKEKEYRSVCATACQMAMNSLKKGASALDVVALAVTYLEDAACTNAGIGSSLSLEGTVECDASVMDGQSLAFGAVGAISDVKNPILVAKKLVEEQKQGTLSLGRVPPCTMVGSGATKWATEHGITRVSPDTLKTKSSVKTYNSHKRKLLMAEEKKKHKKRKYLRNHIHDRMDEEENLDFVCNGIQDTVGAVCIDMAGNMAAGVSSGGISLKQLGRLGPAALYGAGCWAVNWKSDVKPGIAVATSGTGEHLMKTLLARECCQCLQQDDFTENAFKTVFQDQFLDSEFLHDTKEKFGGILALKFDRSDTGSRHCELLWGHTTDSMCIGFMSSNSKVKTVISRLEDDKKAGTTFVMEGKTVKL
ncbi:threonine aspartase 1-like isoform X2 [Mercenaria mercenaria]|uniref:threonine aspartase 1-like isoform X2 n=1 Tax=Mercenaria mercenaria TaxID=6596 RepID=UPI00234EA609|nr:threonine aspartase 1-like isoform X2 [Mercenaria mercenaria]